MAMITEQLVRFTTSYSDVLLTDTQLLVHMPDGEHVIGATAGPNRK